MKNHDFSDSAWREAMDTAVLAAEMHSETSRNVLTRPLYAMESRKRSRTMSKEYFQCDSQQ